MQRPSAHRGISAALAISIVACIIAATGGAFYFGQNSVRVISVPQDSTTVQTLQTVETILTTQTVYAIVSDTSSYGGSNAQTMTLTSALLNSGSSTTATASTDCSGANFQLTFNNPGGATYISQLSMSSGGNTVPLTYYTTSSTSNTCTLTTLGSGDFVLNAGTSTSLDLYFGLTTPSSLNSGSTYNYFITFGNGQTISGTIIAE